MRRIYCLPLVAIVAALPNVAFAREDAANGKEHWRVEAKGGAQIISNPIISYPKTNTVAVVDEQFGIKVADPYRWLEDDVRVAPAVADWVGQQNAVTDAYLKTLPGKDVLAARMKKLYDYERFGLPEKAGKRYFFTKNDGLQNQSVLYARSGLNGKDRVLIDPNTWAKDGATALDAWVPSKDGKLLAYAIQDGGSDWRTIRVLEVKSGKVLPDEIKWAKFTNIAWVGDGFIYSRFAEPKEGAAFQSLNYDQTVYFHKIGTLQAEDQVVYATPDRPELGHSAEVTHDGRWAVITSSAGTDEKYEINLIPLAGQASESNQIAVKALGQTQTTPSTRKALKSERAARQSWTIFPLIAGLEHEWQLVEGVGNMLYFVTNKNAPRLKVVACGRIETINRDRERVSS